jgi:hypothetical protein
MRTSSQSPRIAVRGIGTLIPIPGTMRLALLLADAASAAVVGPRRLTCGQGQTPPGPSCATQQRSPTPSEATALTPLASSPSPAVCFTRTLAEIGEGLSPGSYGVAPSRCDGTVAASPSASQRLRESLCRGPRPSTAGHDHQPTLGRGQLLRIESA